ncbi:MAG: MATE family efflux transporter [Clostridia bacterium]|nr:MATE family efflux transporter [Clostridia bacterium]
MKKTQNLTEGSVTKQLILFAIPFLASNIIQSLYNVADMLIVGNFSGSISMSGVNIGGQVTFILTNFIMGLCTGGTVLVAQAIGAGDKESVKETISTLITGLVIAGLVITGVMLFLKDPVLRLIQTPAESFSEASDYLLVTMLGVIFIFAYNALSAIQRGMGDSKRPFYFVCVACVTNIILDFVLVAGMGMGAKGAAVATVISQALSVILCVVYLAKTDFPFDFKLGSFKIYTNKLKMIFKIGMPTAIQNSVSSISFLFITALVNMVGGVYASAAVGVVGKFNGFALMPAIAMGAAVSTMAAQNIGAKQWKRAEKCMHIGLVIGIIASYAIFIVAQMFPEQILSMFDKTPEMIENGVAYMRSFSCDYLIVPFMFVANGLFTGAGHTKFTLITSVLSSLLLRIPASYIFGITLSMGLFGIGFGGPVASLGAVLLIAWFYFTGKWKVNTVTGEKMD